MDALLAAVFEAGKVAGEFGRLPPRGRSAPDGGMRV
jgi:hypothetical protein